MRPSPGGSGGGKKKPAAKKKASKVQKALGVKPGDKPPPGFFDGTGFQQPKANPKAAARSKAKVAEMYAQQDRVGYLVFGPIGGTIAKKVNNRFGPGQRRGRGR